MRRKLFVPWARAASKTVQFWTVAVKPSRRRSQFGMCSVWNQCVVKFVLCLMLSNIVNGVSEISSNSYNMQKYGSPAPQTDLKPARYS